MLERLFSLIFLHKMEGIFGRIILFFLMMSKTGLGMEYYYDYDMEVYEGWCYA